MRINSFSLESKAWKQCNLLLCAYVIKNMANKIMTMYVHEENNLLLLCTIINSETATA